MKKNVKKLMLFLTSLIITFSFGTISYATASIIPTKINPTLSNATMEGQVSDVLGVIRIVCIAVAIGMMLYVGMKYMMASANEKADVKNASIRYVIGAIIVLSCATLFPIILSAAETVTNTGAVTPGTKSVTGITPGTTPGVPPTYTGQQYGGGANGAGTGIYGTVNEAK